MKIFTCNLCKKPSLGKEKPTHCPFCGAISKHLVHPQDHYDDDFLLQPNIKNYLQRLADDKYQNSIFYQKASESTEAITISHLFHAMLIIENHHLLVLERLGIKPKPPKNKVGIYEFEEDNVADAFHRKTNSVNFIKEILKEIDDPYVTELLAAILEVEEEHVKLVEEYM